MTTQITWTVTSLDCYPQENGNADVVFCVHWTCSGTDGTYNASIYSTCNIPYTGTSFTPYEDLTQQQVLDWVWDNGVDQAVTEAAVQQQIDNQINPPVITPPLPWAA
jgi:hypothetical protein